MKKVRKEGKVAVLVSSGFGAGWYSWNEEYKELLFHPKLVSMVEQNRQNEINEEWILENIGISDVYCGGANSLYVQWLQEGTAFMVEEYDGAEYIKTLDSLTIVA